MSNSIIHNFWRCLGSLFGERKQRLVFTKVLVDGTLIEGRIEMVKMEFNQSVTFTAEPLDRRGNPASIEAGTAEWTFFGQDADGNDVSDTVAIVVDAANELSATATSATTELTGTLTLRADGDADVGEEAFVVATESVIVDGGNVVGLALTHTEPVDV